MTQITSREFNQDTSGAKKAAAHGPVYITDRGRPAHVLLSYDDYERLLGTGHVLDELCRTGVVVRPRSVGASAEALGVGSIRRSAREIVLVERDGAARGQPDGFGSARNGPVGAQAGAICQVPLMVRAPSAVSRARLIAPPSRFQSASTRAWPRRLARRPDRRSLCASLRSTLGRVAR